MQQLQLLVFGHDTTMGRFRKSQSKPASKVKLSSGELKFITDHTSFTEDHIKEWHKVNLIFISGGARVQNIFYKSKHLKGRFGLRVGNGNVFGPKEVSWTPLLVTVTFLDQRRSVGQGGK